MSLTPGGKPPRQPNTDTIIRDIWRRLDALEKLRPSSGGGGTTLARSDVTVMTNSLGTGASQDVSFPFGGSYLIFRMQTDQAVRARIYTNHVDLETDRARTSGPPAESVGLILDLTTHESARYPAAPTLDYHLSPMVIGANLPRYTLMGMQMPHPRAELSLDTFIEVASPGIIENLGSSGVRTLTFTILQLEQGTDIPA